MNPEDKEMEKGLSPYALEDKPGFALSWFFYKLFKRVRVEEAMREKLKQMHREGTVVYTIKYRGRLDYLMYHYNFRFHRLPYPRLAFDLNISMLLPLARSFRILSYQVSHFLRRRPLPDPYESGLYREAIHRGTPSLLFLIDPAGFMEHFVRFEKDRLEFLLEVQQGLERPIFLVPMLALYTKSPEKDYTNLQTILFGFKDHPGTLRKIALFFRYHRQALIDFAEPMNLLEYLRSQPEGRHVHDMALEVKTRLIEGIDSQKRVVLGPILKSRQQFKEIVLKDPVVTRRIQTESSGKEGPMRRLRKKAGKYFDEIAGDYNITYIQVFHVLLRWLWTKLFQEIDVEAAGLAEVREWARRGHLIYVPSHKSHIDYLLLNYVLYVHHMHIPRVAAGKNLAFWPMGHVFRRSGAFFIRRSFKQERLYVDVFNRYIKALLEDGHPIQFYIEGGRSRNGKLVFPKTGFLAILLQAFREGYCKDLIFVPASIAYDRVLEEKSYIKEMSGVAKEPESLRHIFRARRFLRTNYGKAYIRFATPFSLSEYLSRKPSGPQEARQDLALHLVRAINAVTPVTPLALISTALLAHHRRGFLFSELWSTTETLMGYLERHEIPMASTLSDPQRALKDSLSLLIDWKIVDSLEDVEGEEEPFYYVDEEKKIQLEYYKNSTIHYFIENALVALSLLKGKEEMKSEAALLDDCAFLENLFRHEFVPQVPRSPQDSVGTVMDYFMEQAWVTRIGEPESFRVTKSGYEQLSIWAGLARTFVESYWIAAKSMSLRGYRLEKRDRQLKHMAYLGKRLYKSGAVDHVAALSPLNFQNALSFIQKDLLAGGGPAAKDPASAQEKLTRLGQRLYEFLH
ncbi:MAG: 1-acyl-sn-glycerol-3-phosphate acyltransferase [Thermodesulfobacteriota bacterium]